MNCIISADGFTFLGLTHFAPMISINLPHHEWQYDPNRLLGEPGGFGAVYLGSGQNGVEVAVKRLSITARQTAHREMDMAAHLMNRELHYVLPVLDAGQDTESDYYYVVMPKAGPSLQETVDQSGALDKTYAIEVLLDIARGLIEVRHIVHRDLKPQNILYHDGTWKVADFGIARFVESATASDTVREFLSAEYAAPEQWTSDHATNKTDVYALGCIAHTILQGRSPFAGAANRAEYRNRHLSQPPPDLENVPAQFQILVGMMLRKEPERRPSLDRVLEILIELTSNRTTGVSSALSAAGAAVAREIAEEEARLHAEAARARSRTDLARAAREELRQLLSGMGDEAGRLAPIVEVRNAPRFRIILGSASLEVSLSDTYPLLEGAFRNSKWDVLTDATVTVTQNKNSTYVWSANLLFARRAEEEDYRWWELSFFDLWYSKHRSQYAPYALTDLNDMDLALSPILHGVQLATTPRPIDDEKAPDFYRRWLQLLATAAQGGLRHPSSLPLDQP